ncbi:MAG: hypothetical protein ABIJ92_01120 [Candidatus Aenigmatarchaeota archaeon]
MHGLDNPNGRRFKSSSLTGEEDPGELSVRELLFAFGTGSSLMFEYERRTSMKNHRTLKRLSVCIIAFLLLAPQVLATTGGGAESAWDPWDHGDTLILIGLIIAIGGIWFTPKKWGVGLPITGLVVGIILVVLGLAI